MEFNLTEEQRMLQDLARDFAEREIKPAAHHHDTEESFPHAIYEKALQIGLLNVALEEQYGGGGMGVMENILVSQWLSWGCAGIASALTINSLVSDAIEVGASPEQKATYLKRLTSGGFGAYCVTEPDAGSDVAGMKMRATRQNGHYVLNGSKVWISNAPLAQFFVVFARTAPEGGHKGLSAFLVERDTPGVTVGAPIPKMGQKACPAAEVFFDNAEIPESARMGNEGDGFLIAMKVFDRSRPMVAAFGLGIIQRALDESLAYATTRKSMGVPIIQHQAIGHKIAEMGMRLEAARLLTYQAAWLVDNGQRNTLPAAYAKAFAADTAMWAATEAVQIFGGMGYSKEYPAEKLMRDAKVLQIYEGTSEIQRNVMARELARR